MPRKLWHLPLESYQARYTELLFQWEKAVFEPRCSYREVIPPFSSGGGLSGGEVLDAHFRSLWALEQISMLLKMAPDGGAVYLSDFFHPGIEALPYSRKPFEISAFCWAQSFDRYDFTAAMVNWMRAYEVMASMCMGAIFVAHPLLEELLIAAIPSVKEHTYVVGLPFNSKAVHNLAAAEKIRTDRPYHVAYTSRWDLEKVPSMFVELVRMRPDLQFVVCTGLPELAGTDHDSINRIQRLAREQKNVTILTDLTKSDYYAVLASTQVQLNTGLQDWISFTLLEALTFGCSPLYPMHRSFLEALMFQAEFMYIPNNLADLNRKLSWILAHPRQFMGQPILDYHDKTLDRIAAIIT